MKQTKLFWLVMIGWFFGLSNAANAGCAFGKQKVAGSYGGYTFYHGLMYQIDPQTGKRLAANKGVRANSAAHCAKLCARAPARGCRSVTWRHSESRNCLLYAGYDFVTKRRMSIGIYHGGGSARSALVRSGFQGRLCKKY